MSEYKRNHSIDGWPICKNGEPMTYRQIEKELNELQSTISRLEGENKWISVEERLPKDGELVFVAIPVTCNSIGWIFETTHFYEDDGCFYMHDDVTHWRPLPPPPTEGDEE